MQLEKDQTALEPESSDNAQDKETAWLLERDLDEPEDSLFSVPEEKYETSLTAYEAEIAGRPMFRGHGEGDDLSLMVGEEIVMSEVGGESDIYASSNVGTRGSAELASTPLTIDHTAGYGGAEQHSEIVVEDGEDILSLLDEDDIGDHHLVLVQAKAESKKKTQAEIEASQDNPEELELTLESTSELQLEPMAEEESDLTLADSLDLEAELDIDAELDLAPVLDDEPDLALADSPDVEAGLDLDFELGLPVLLEDESDLLGVLETEEPLDSETTFEIGLELDLKSDLEETEENETGVVEGESVLDYISNTPTPSDDEAFDEYLLGGQQFESATADSSGLTIVPVDGIVEVDPLVDGDIDYHEDFQNMEGFNENTLSAITGIIAQVMEEVSSAVSQRLTELSIDPELVKVEAMLGNDVESIIECVTDGYVPIIDVRPELPAVLRQLGQSEVDAIYVRISHCEISGNWNGLFHDDFEVPESDLQAETLEAAEIDSSPQPFASFDLDEFDFDEPIQGESSDLTAADFDHELDAFASVSNDDPLASIDFATLADGDAQEEYTAGFQTQSKGLVEEADEQGSSDDELQEQPPTDDFASWCVPGELNFNSCNNSDAELFEEFLDVFMEEATSELERLEDAIGNWDAGNEAPHSVPAPIVHSLHTLKGIAKGVGLHKYGTLVHNYETLLDGLVLRVGEDGRMQYFKIVNAWLDAVVQGFDDIEKTRLDVGSELPSPKNLVTRTVPKAVEETDTVVESAPDPVVESQDKSSRYSPAKLVDAPAAKPASESLADKQLADEGAKSLAAQQTIRMTSEALDNLSNLTNQAQQLGVRSSENAVKSKHAASEALARLSSVRAHIVKIADRALTNVTAKGSHKGTELDALEMDQYSELQEAANILRESVEDLDDLIRGASRQISMSEALLKQQSSVISSLGSSIQAVRVVPMSRLFPGLRRIVRTIGSDLGKNVSFRVLNQVGTLDRDNHARCQVILEHMVRNAMDHGIESPEQRAEQGKPASGTISIDVNKRGADYIITLADDGRGVAPELMRETAYRRGLDIDVDALSDDEAIRLIFHKGFSTASSVSEISGRGVGMDIVLSELKKIGGDIEIESTVGEGSRFHIRIPPNVSVNGALLVSAAERSYAIPLDGLVAVDYVDVDVFYNAVAEEKSLSLAGVECDPAYLATLCHGDSLPDSSTWAKSIPVLIAGSEERYMAIAVDDVKQALELVIRSLGVQFSSIPGVAGATTTADGQAVVALDLNAMVESVGLELVSSMSPEQELAEQLLVLVVDDSRTQRMVSTSQFDTLGVETITAENGMVAIDLLNTTHRLPDVILLDVEMPVKDGIQTLREIRKSTRYPHIPVIMVTSRTGSKHRALADEAGCDGYMGKPFNFPMLVEQISQLTGHKLEIS